MPKEPSRRRQLVMLAKAFKTEPNPSETSLAKLAIFDQLLPQKVALGNDRHNLGENVCGEGPAGGEGGHESSGPVASAEREFIWFGSTCRKTHRLDARSTTGLSLLNVGSPRRTVTLDGKSSR